MRAAVIEEHGEPLTIQDVPYPEPQPDQVVIETEACGVCRSDWHAWQGDWEWFGIQTGPGQILATSRPASSPTWVQTSNSSPRGTASRSRSTSRRVVPVLPARAREHL